MFEKSVSRLVVTVSLVIILRLSHRSCGKMRSASSKLVCKLMAHSADVGESLTNLVMLEASVKLLALT